MEDDRRTRRRIFGVGTGSEVWIRGVGLVGVDVLEYSVRVIIGG
jgi:hypothetical protein